MRNCYLLTTSDHTIVQLRLKYVLDVKNPRGKEWWYEWRIRSWYCLGGKTFTQPPVYHGTDATGTTTTAGTDLTTGLLDNEITIESSIVVPGNDSDFDHRYIIMAASWHKTDAFTLLTLILTIFELA